MREKVAQHADPKCVESFAAAVSAAVTAARLFAAAVRVLLHVLRMRMLLLLQDQHNLSCWRQRNVLEALSLVVAFGIAKGYLLTRRVSFIYLHMHAPTHASALRAGMQPCMHAAFYVVRKQRLRHLACFGAVVRERPRTCAIRAAASVAAAAAGRQPEE